MNRSGIVVHIRPVSATALHKRLTTLSGVKVHTVRQDGRMVITVEDDGQDIVPAEMLQRIQSLPDVLSAILIYSYFGSMQNSVPGGFPQGNWLQSSIFRQEAA